MILKILFKNIHSKTKYFKTIQMQFLIYIALLIIGIILVLDGVFYYMSVGVITKDAQEYASQITSQIGRNIEYYVNYMKDISYILNNDAKLNNSSNKEKITNESSVLVKAITQTRRDIVSIVILNNKKIILADKDTYKIKSSMDVQRLDWYKRAIEAKGKPVFSSSHVQNFIDGQYPWVVSLSNANYDRYNSFIGVTLIDINYKVFTDLCNKVQIGKKGYVFIIDKNGDMVYHPNQQLIYSNIKEENIRRILSANDGSYNDFKENENKLITVKSLPSIGWKVVGVTYMNDILIQKEDLMRVLTISTIICLIIAIIISIKVSSNISNPIYKLEKLMRRVEKGELDIDINIKGSNEVAHLAQTFSIMVIRIKGLLQKIEEDQSKLRKSELKTLYAQINPHFLYNALDTIIWAAELDENEKVVRMTSALSKYFRISLSKGKEVITISQEIEHIKNYLIIQKIRYDSKLDYEINLEDDIKMYKTMKMLLQPLIENAIYHGIKNLPDGGKIWITGKRTGNNIHLVVRDNGVGMDSEALRNILMPKEDNPLTSGGVAIINVNQRIQLYFGNQYGLEFQSEQLKGTTVTVIIPIVE